MKKLIYLAVGLLFCLSSCAPEPHDSPVYGKKIAYVINMPESEIFTLFAQGCQETAQKLGMSFNKYFSGGNNEKFLKAIQDCAADESINGIIISHMDKTIAYNTIKDLTEKYPNKKIVTFDTEFIKDNKETTIKHVTQIFQDDEDLSSKLLTFLDEDYRTDKSQPLKVLKVWKGPGFLSAFDRRDISYQKFEEQGIIKTVATVGPLSIGNKNAEEEQTKKAVADALATYPEEEIDAIWCAYDVYAQGAYAALKEAKRNIPLVSVDLSNRDIQSMLENNSAWKASSCTDFKANGEQATRVLALELNNQYNQIIVPGYVGPICYIEMPATLIKGSILTPSTTIENIYEVAPATYGDKSFFVTCDWMKKLIGY